MEDLPLITLNIYKKLFRIKTHTFGLSFKGLNLEIEEGWLSCLFIDLLLLSDGASSAMFTSTFLETETVVPIAAYTAAYVQLKTKH